MPKLLLLLILVCLLAVLAWQLVGWLRQGDNAFIVFCVFVFSVMFFAGLRDDARKWR